MLGIIIDKNSGYKKDFVVINDYELQEGEAIIEKGWEVANSMNRPQWQFDTEEWIDTDPLPPEEIEPEEPNQMEILEKRVAELEQKNKLLEARNEALSKTTDFHEELIAEMAMKVYA